MTNDSFAARFSRLNDSNYAEWALRMEAVLVRAGLWAMIDIAVDETNTDASTIASEIEDAKKKRSAEKMNEAHAEIILRVEDGQLAHCMRSTDPREIWHTLESVHRAAGFATSLALRRKFLTAKKTSTQTMQAWLGQVQALAFRLQQAGIVISDQDKILALTMGLPPAYDAVIINFDSTPSDQLTLNHVIARLLNEEVRQIASNPDVPEDNIDEAMAATPGGKARRSRQAGNNADITCFFCDKKGHYKSECPDKRAWDKSKGKEVAAAFEELSDSESEGFF
jgi:hypothetical protein